MESYTWGKVSGLAKRAWEASVWNDGISTSFEKIAGGYRMYGWASQIERCRAMGRGAYSGLGKAPSKYDSQEIKIRS